MINHNILRSIIDKVAHTRWHNKWKKLHMELDKTVMSHWQTKNGGYKPCSFMSPNIGDRFMNLSTTYSQECKYCFSHIFLRYINYRRIRGNYVFAFKKPVCHPCEREKNLTVKLSKNY